MSVRAVAAPLLQTQDDGFVRVSVEASTFIERVRQLAHIAREEIALAARRVRSAEEEMEERAMADAQGRALVITRLRACRMSVYWAMFAAAVDEYRPPVGGIAETLATFADVLGMHEHGVLPQNAWMLAICACDHIACARAAAAEQGINDVKRGLTSNHDAQRAFSVHLVRSFALRLSETSPCLAAQLTITCNNLLGILIDTLGARGFGASALAAVSGVTAIASHWMPRVAVGPSRAISDAPYIIQTLRGLLSVVSLRPMPSESFDECTVGAASAVRQLLAVPGLWDSVHVSEQAAILAEIAVRVRWACERACPSEFCAAVLLDALTGHPSIVRSLSSLPEERSALAQSAIHAWTRAHTNDDGTVVMCLACAVARFAATLPLQAGEPVYPLPDAGTLLERPRALLARLQRAAANM